MSGEISVNDEDDGEFHSAFDLGLGDGALDTFKWLIIGHLLYVVGLAVAVALSIEMGNVWMTPLYVLPLLWADRKNRPWVKALVLIAGFTAAHYAGVRVAIETVGRSSEPTLIPGLWGGAAGGVLALVACFAFRLTRPGVPTLVLGVFGLALLAAAGSFGVYMYLTSGSGDAGVGGEIVRLLWIYTPWQVVFAYVLAKVLKPIRR